jgi:hypothetical protein
MKKLSFVENLTYYISVILSFGSLYILKVIIKKAIIDADNE